MYPLGASSVACFVLSPDDECRAFLDLRLCWIPFLFSTSTEPSQKHSKTPWQPLEIEDPPSPRRVALICLSDPVPPSGCGRWFVLHFYCVLVRGRNGADPTMQTDPSALARLIPFAVQDAFSEPDQLLTAYFHESTVGLGILDRDFRYLAINPALAQMNGVPAAAHLGKTCREVLGDFADKFEPELQRILDTGQAVVGLELSGILPTRNEVGYWIENYFPIKDASGKVKQIGEVVVEITEQRKVEESHRQLTSTLQQEKDRLQVLLDIDATLASSLDLPQLFTAIASCVAKVIPYDLAGTWLYDQTHQIMRTAALDSRVGDVFLAGRGHTSRGMHVRTIDARRSAQRSESRGAHGNSRS